MCTFSNARHAFGWWILPMVPKAHWQTPHQNTPSASPSPIYIYIPDLPIARREAQTQGVLFKITSLTGVLLAGTHSFGSQLKDRNHVIRSVMHSCKPNAAFYTEIQGWNATLGNAYRLWGRHIMWQIHSYGRSTVLDPEFYCQQFRMFYLSNWSCKWGKLQNSGSGNDGHAHIMRISSKMARWAHHITGVSGS